MTALRERNPPITDELPKKEPVMRSLVFSLLLAWYTVKETVGLLVMKRHDVHATVMD